MDPTILLFGLLIVAFVAMLFSSRNAKKRQQAQREEMKAQMVPGAWVMTTSGFYGRYVETDGDVVVLETGDGVETYWLARAIATVSEPPFASEAEVKERAEKETEAPAEQGEAQESSASEAESENVQDAPESK